LLTFFQTQYIFSHTDESSDLEWTTSRGAGETIVYGLLGSGEVVFSNLLVMTYNYLYGMPWAFPTHESVRRNFTMPWIWEDTDGFKVNNIGHPIQGLVYYNAGRVNGFNYYESVFFSALGSFTWEAFSETQQASINDFFITCVGSLSLGEMFYRLYLEACERGVPPFFAMFINPTAGVHRMITRWKPPDYGKNLEQFYFHIGPSYVQTNSSISPGNRERFSFRGPVGDMGFAAIYGNPFEQESRIPFRHFELKMSFGVDPGNYMNIRLISDGYLLSFSPVYTEKNFLSTGLSIHYDFVSQGEYSLYDGTIDQSSFALDWTMKYKHLFSDDAAFETKFHTGYTYLGVSNFYAPGIRSSKDELKNYGTGINSKLYINLIHRKLGRIETSVFYYMLWSYPKTSVLTQGTVLWLFTDAAYILPLTEHVSMGIGDSFSLEYGKYKGFHDTYKTNNVVKLFVAWNI